MNDAIQTSMSHQVFISYSSKDKEFVHPLHDYLEEKEIACWIDREGITAGDNFCAEFSPAIQASTIVLFIVSSNSIQTKFVLDEISNAYRLDKRIIPIWIENVVYPDALEFQVGSIHKLDLTDKASEENKKERVLQAIRKALYNKTPPVTENRRRNSPLLSRRVTAILVSIIGFILLIVWAQSPVDTIPVEMTVQVEGIEFDLERSHSALHEERKPPLLEKPVRLASIEASGLQKIQYPSHLRMGRDFKEAASLYIQAYHAGERADSGLIVFDVNRHPGAGIRILSDSSSSFVQFFMWNYGTYVPDVTVSGALTFKLQSQGERKGGIYKDNAEAGRIAFVPVKNDEVHFKLEVNQETMPAIAKRIPIDAVRFSLMQYPVLDPAQRPVSMIQKGMILLGDEKSLRYDIDKGQHATFQVIDGDIRELTIDSRGISLSFHGIIRDLKIGYQDQLLSRMPSRLRAFISDFTF